MDELARRIKNKMLLDKYLKSIPEIGDAIFFNSISEFNATVNHNCNDNISDFIPVRMISKEEYSKLYENIDLGSYAMDVKYDSDGIHLTRIDIGDIYKEGE